MTDRVHALWSQMEDDDDEEDPFAEVRREVFRNAHAWVTADCEVTLDRRRFRRGRSRVQPPAR